MLRLMIIFLFFYAGMLHAQDLTDSVQKPDIFEELQSDEDGNGYVSLRCTPEIHKLIRLHTSINEKQKSVTGYRIQIFSGSSYDHSIETLQNLKAGFEATFPDIPAYLNYFDPDFKIRVGNFKNRLDCIPALRKIRRHYPSCYPVKTEIPLSDLDKLSQPDPVPTEEATEDSQLSPAEE